MSLNLPNDKFEGCPRIPQSEGANAEKSDVPRIGLSWEKNPGLVRWETPDGDSELFLETFTLGRDLQVVASQLRF